MFVLRVTEKKTPRQCGALFALVLLKRVVLRGLSRAARVVRFINGHYPVNNVRGRVLKKL